MPQYSYAVGDMVQVTTDGGQVHQGKVVALRHGGNLLVEYKLGKDRYQVIRLPSELKPLHVEPAR